MTAVIVFSAFSVASAQDARVETNVNANADVRVSPQRADLKNRLDAAKNVLKERVEVKKQNHATVSEQERMERKEKIRQQVLEIRKESAVKRKEFVAARYTQAIEVIGKHQSRVEVLIDRQKANGKDTASAQASFDASAEALVNAKASLEKFKSMSAEAKGEVAALREQAKKVEQYIIASRNALIKTVRTLASASASANVRVESETTLQAQ